MEEPCVPVVYEPAELIELGRGVYPEAYIRTELHCPPKWNITGPTADGSALYDHFVVDCKDKAILHKVIRTINPRLGIVDTRTLKVIQAGCCPKTLLMKFLEAEGAPD